jgi:hypothetical protein
MHPALRPIQGLPKDIDSKIDMGCVVVNSDLAKRIGFNSTIYNADWIYFDEILKTNPSIHKIDKILFVHN